WCHRAFSPWNICRADGEVRVTDWEEAKPGLPLVDLLYFSFHWSHHAYRPANLADRLVLLRELFCEPPWKEPAFAPVHAAISGYMERLEIDRRFFSLALVLTMVDHAVGRFRRAQALDRRSASSHTEASLRSLAAESGDPSLPFSASSDIPLNEWEPPGQGIAVSARHRNDYVKYVRVLAESTDSLFSDAPPAITQGEKFLALLNEGDGIDEPGKSIPILMYHLVTARPPDAFRKYSVSPRTFASHMSWLASEGYHPISMRDLLEARCNRGHLPPRPMLLTFDDGYQQCLDNVVPILRQHGF